ncbi:MAG: cupin domain-containing protein [Elusimicrobia bacterium]|nr:cupin domain-containing protein [Elusimicrobiota bacterium]
MKRGVTTVKKPWGHELIYAQARKYAGKILVINKGRRLSRQYHKVKHETIYVLKGRLSLELKGRVRLARPGQCFAIPPKAVHRFSAPRGRVTLLEVSTPELWDVVRLSDDYGRK